MVTQKGDNTFVVGIHGNFDDAQSGVKAIFGDKELAKELDAGRISVLLCQLHQYRTSGSADRLLCICLCKTVCKAVRSKMERTINVVVPTGNFGNILAAYYAKQMGMPIGKLICASNDNKVLYDFFRTGDV